MPGPPTGRSATSPMRWCRKAARPTTWRAPRGTFPARSTDQPLPDRRRFSMEPVQQRFGYGAQAQSAALFDEGLRQHMLRVYNYMGAGLVITGLIAFVV